MPETASLDGLLAGLLVRQLPLSWALQVGIGQCTLPNQPGCPAVQLPCQVGVSLSMGMTGLNTLKAHVL